MIYIYTAPLTGIYVFHWNLLTCDAAEMNTTLYSSHGPLDYVFISHVDSFLSRSLQDLLPERMCGLKKQSSMEIPFTKDFLRFRDIFSPKLVNTI